MVASIQHALWLSSFFVILAISSADRTTTDFDLKPGGMVQNVKHEKDGVECKFTYTSQGGTHEKWQFSIESAGNGGDYQCVVERPSGTSYLFFQQFKMEVNGAEVVDGRAYGSSGPLSPSEFDLDNTKGHIVHVDGQFSSQLVKVELEVRKRNNHSDL